MGHGRRSIVGRQLRRTDHGPWTFAYGLDEFPPLGTVPATYCGSGGTMYNRDEVKGKVDEVTGHVKKAAGDMNDDPDLRSEGEAQEIGGRVQKGFGRARRKVGEAVKDV